MQQELKLKYFNSKLQIGFNFPSRIYDVKNECWIEGKVHAGRLVAQINPFENQAVMKYLKNSCKSIVGISNTQCIIAA